ncbi:hypothetical protein EE612_053787, partial [Oryza sativa]
IVGILNISSGTIP